MVAHVIRSARGKTRLITDAELRKLFEYLDRAEAEALEHPFILIAIRLQFEFAARRSEILKLEWGWIDFDNRRVVWPDSKTGGMMKPMRTWFTPDTGEMVYTFQGEGVRVGSAHCRNASS